MNINEFSHFCILHLSWCDIDRSCQVAWPLKPSSKLKGWRMGEGRTQVGFGIIPCEPESCGKLLGYGMIKSIFSLASQIFQSDVFGFCLLTKERSAHLSIELLGIFAVVKDLALRAYHHLSRDIYQWLRQKKILQICLKQVWTTTCNEFTSVHKLIKPVNFINSYKFTMFRYLYFFMNSPCFMVPNNFRMIQLRHFEYSCPKQLGVSWAPIRPQWRCTFRRSRSSCSSWHWCTGANVGKSNWTSWSSFETVWKKVLSVLYTLNILL